MGADAYCPERIAGETLADKASHALWTCAPVVTVTLDSHVPRWPINGGDDAGPR